MPNLTFYRFDGACSLAAHTLLTDLGLDFKAVPMKRVDGVVSSVDGTITNEQYRKIHPDAKIPALEVDGEPINENVAILSYIGSLAPERNLSGKTDLERARVLHWLAYISSTLHGMGWTMFFVPERFSTDAAHVDAIREKSKDVISHAYTRVNERLEGKEFPVGQAETVVDYYLIPMYYWGLRMGFDMEKYPNYKRVIQRMEKKAALQSVKKEEGVDVSA